MIMRKHAKTQRGRVEDGFTDWGRVRKVGCKKNKKVSCFFMWMTFFVNFWAELCIR